MDDDERQQLADYEQADTELWEGIKRCEALLTDCRAKLLGEDGDGPSTEPA